MKTLIKSGIIIFALVSVFYLSCKKDSGDSDNNKYIAPVVTTDTVYNVGSNMASVRGNIVSYGSEGVISYGICYGTSPNPEVTGEQSGTPNKITGKYSKTIIDLSDSTVYYTRAYASNTRGVSYGSQLTFATLKKVTDNEGNTINIVRIGSQIWMAKNLNVTHYNNGDSIPNITNDSVWNSMNDYIKGAYCNYNNDSSNATIYGRLYNWYAIADKRGVCPTGYHVPSDAEWTILVNAIGGDQVAGKLKETGTIHWQSPNEGADNSTGFTALPGGGRWYNGDFNEIHTATYFWSSSNSPSNRPYATVWSYALGFSDSQITRGEDCKNSASSVRCIKN